MFLIIKTIAIIRILFPNNIFLSQEQLINEVLQPVS
jgi:hypothetical protein